MMGGAPVVMRAGSNMVGVLALVLSLGRDKGNGTED